MERALQFYSFTYLDGDGAVLRAFDAECADDDAAIDRGFASKSPDAAVVEITCGARTVAKRRLDNDDD
jgi:hypothetical protein